MTPAQATARMQQINASVPPNDGVGLFNRVYLLSRQNVLKAADQGFFPNPAYIRRLDSEFVKYWLKAYDTWHTKPGNLPACWRPLFINRQNMHVLPIQFILAGLTAHIFRDLSLAVFDTENWLDVIPNKLFQGRHFKDYNKVSTVLEQTMNESVLPEFRDSYQGQLLLGIDALLAGFSIRLARIDAWDRGNTMRLISPFGSTAEGTPLDRAFDLEAGALAAGFLAPPLADLLP